MTGSKPEAPPEENQKHDQKQIGSATGSKPEAPPEANRKHDQKQIRSTTGSKPEGRPEVNKNQSRKQTRSKPEANLTQYIESQQISAKRIILVWLTRIHRAQPMMAHFFAKETTKLKFNTGTQLPRLPQLHSSRRLA